MYEKDFFFSFYACLLYLILLLWLLCNAMFSFRLYVCMYIAYTATVYGEGVYFAVDFSYSAQRTYSPPDSSGVKYVFQCRVLTGQFVVGSPGMKEPPQRPGTKHRYDSVTNNVNDPKVFVVFKDTQCYPEYLVAFKG